MDIKLCKEFGSLYDEINKKIKNLSDESDALQLIFSENNKGYTYELPAKEIITEKIKEYAKHAKDVNDMIKLFKKNINACKDPLVKDLFSQKYSILASKYCEQVKSAINIKNKHKAYVEEEKISTDKRVALRQQLQEEPNSIVTDVYNNTVSRSKEVELLAVDIIEIRQMFEDLALLINEQHEMLGQIDIHIEEASVRVNTGNKKLTEAIELQKKTRKKYCCCALVLIIVIIIIIMGVVIPVKLFAL